MAPFLSMRNITKRFPGVLANDRVNLTVEAGEIHALLGENGAGKSTLMQILYGLYGHDEGEILVEGRPVTIRNPRDAIALGIGMIHQDFMLIPRFTVVENVVMGLDEDGPTPLLDLKGAAHRLSRLSERYGLAIDPRARVEHLSVGVQQRVEILKLLYRNARLLILDEPTAVLTPQETEGLVEVLRSLARQGHAIIFITHKLHEVMAVADRVSVIARWAGDRHSRNQGEHPRDLAKMMVGREVVFHIEKEPHEPGALALQAVDLSVVDDTGYQKVCCVSLDVRCGEIVGLAGVDGNGQSELAEALMSLRPVQCGRVLVMGTDVTCASPAAHRTAGMAYIPADRRTVGSLGELSIAHNAILGDVSGFTAFGNLFLDARRIKAYAETLLKRFDVRAPNTIVYGPEAVGR